MYAFQVGGVKIVFFVFLNLHSEMFVSIELHQHLPLCFNKKKKVGGLMTADFLKFLPYSVTPT